ncbi:MAG: hypothetical protein IT162_21570 [Bryobacterales bacterium]|nr:hypothetical protein [Bryobacterales bacterium]
MALLCYAALASAENRVKPGELLIEPPTLINLGFEWVVEGDDNRNSQVAAAYRKQGEAAWQPALPLLRLQREHVFQAPGIWDLVAPNMFAGSILDLAPGTAYEVKLTLSDPDGAIGSGKGPVTKTVTVRTRPEPRPSTGGRVFHVYPPGYKGPMQEPAFDALMCAYNYTCGGGDTVAAARPRVRPGDTILVHAGTYKYRPEYYGDRTLNATTPFEGTYYLTASGTPDQPIAIKGAGDGEAIFDGNGNFNLFNLKAANYNYLEGITIRNTGIAIWAGTQFQSGSKGLTVKRCRFQDVGLGVYTNYSGSSNFYIADSTFIGRNDPHHLLGWAGSFWAQFKGVEGQEYPPTIASYTAVRLYGAGHVVAHNYITGFHDGIDIETYGNPDGSSATDGPKYPPREYWDRRPVAIDFYNNYLTNFHDNPIEIDGGMHNIRVMRNVMINSASHPMCNQPAVGGPVYWIRNIVYHAPGGAARVTSGSPGVLFYNNTILSEFSAGQASNLHLRNNLILGQNSAPAIFSVGTYTNYSSSDYNGFRPNPGAPFSFQWNSPRWEVPADFQGLLSAPAGPQQGRFAPTQSRAEGSPGGGGPPTRPTGLEARRYTTLAEFSQATRQDTHSVLVDYDAFVRVPRLDAKDLKTIQRVYKADEFDFGLKADSAAADRGVELPNITDGFTGKAPDLGALESGRAPWRYGPRP